MNEFNRADFLAPSPFTLIGLVLALATLVLFLIAAAAYMFNIDGINPSDFGTPSVLTMLGGGLFLLIGANDVISGSQRG